MTEPNRTENDAVADLAEQAATRQKIEIVDGRVFALVHRGDQIVHEFDTERYEATPSRKTGHATLTDDDSLVAYVKRHADDETTTLWGDLDRGSIVAVFNDHNAATDDGGWGDHRATLKLRETEDWKHWLKNDGQLLSQDAFAEHIEDGVDAIREPAAATMLEIAQSFHAKSGASFSGGRRLSGEVQFTYEETVTAKAGNKGSLEVPETFVLGLAPFEGNDPYAITARFRYRLVDGRLALGYRLIRPDKIRRAAFDDVAAAVNAATDLPVMAGTPRS